MVASVTDTVAKDLDLQLTKSLNQLVRLNCSVFQAKNKSAWKEQAFRQRRSQRRSWRRKQCRPPAWTRLARLPDTQFQKAIKDSADQIARICHRSQLPSCKLFPLSALQMVKLFCLVEDFNVNGCIKVLQFETNKGRRPKNNIGFKRARNVNKEKELAVEWKLKVRPHTQEQECQPVSLMEMSVRAGQ